MLEIANSPWFAVALSIILAAIGIVIGSVVTIRYGNYKKLTYQRRSFGLVFDGVNKLPGMELRYQGYGPSVENLTVSRIAIWNAGRSDVRKVDVLGKENLRIAINSQYLVLAAEIVQQQSAANRFEVITTHDRKAASVRFDFVRPGEGVVIQVVHTGSKDLRVEGALADVTISPSWSRPADEGASINLLVISFTFLVLGALLGGLIVAALHVQVQPSPALALLAWPAKVAVMLMASAFMLAEIFVLGRLGKRPGGLEKFDENF